MDTSMPWVIEVRSGDGTVARQVVDEARVRVGSLASSQICLSGAGISRMHAVIERDVRGQLVVLDLGSATGTWLNGELVTRAALHPGDEIRVGETVLVIEPARAPARASGGAQGVAPTDAMSADESVDPTRGDTLEVLVAWGPTVIEASHLSSCGQFVIGEGDDAQQHVPRAHLPAGVGASFPLAVHEGTSIRVNLPDDALGEIWLDGETLPLDALRDRLSRDRSPTGGYTPFVLPPNARCRVALGELTFHLNRVPSVAPPAGAGLAQILDRRALRGIGAAAILHGIFIALAISIPPAQGALHLDRLNASDRFVEFALRPTRELPPEAPRGGAGDGEPAAPEDEGAVGEVVSARTKTPRPGRATEKATDVVEARERAKDEARRIAETAFTQLEGELASVWGSEARALDSRAHAALDGLLGDGDGATAAMGGRGTRGFGPGGGGNEPSVGMGGFETRGGRCCGGGDGDGTTRFGEGVSRLEKRPKVPTVVPGTPLLVGTMDRDAIQRVIRQHRSEYRYCYERELNTKRHLNGKLVVKFTIGRSGSVVAARLAESTMGDAAVEACVIEKVKRWHFPSPKGGGVVEVTYPFVFKQV